MAAVHPTAPAEAHSPLPQPTVPTPGCVPTRRALEVPAVIAGSVNLLKFSEALARAGIVGRYDSARALLVIEPVPAGMIRIWGGHSGR
jgi:hypothetical protein